MESIREIFSDLIDDPKDAMRSGLDRESLFDLADDIKKNGLINPITVRPVADRYEVVAGHRRFKASKRAGLATMPAIVRVLDDAKTDEMRMHENLYREDVNPVDEARYIRVMVDTHKVEPGALAKMTGKSEAYLKGRYDLLDYPDYLVQAVQQEHVSLSAAQWLARIEDDRVRMEYTRFAILGGITAKRAEAWYRSWMLGSLPREASAFAPAPDEPSAEPRKLMMPCVLCRHDDDIENMGMYYAHRDCAHPASSPCTRGSSRATAAATPVRNS